VKRWTINSHQIFPSDDDFTPVFDGYVITDGVRAYYCERLDDAQKLQEILNLHAR